MLPKDEVKEMKGLGTQLLLSQGTSPLWGSVSHPIAPLRSVGKQINKGLCCYFSLLGHQRPVLE